MHDNQRSINKKLTKTNINIILTLFVILLFIVVFVLTSFINKPLITEVEQHRTNNFQLKNQKDSLISEKRNLKNELAEIETILRSK